MRVNSLLVVLAVCIILASVTVDAKLRHKAGAAPKVQQYTPAALADQIQSLPGLSVQATFNQFSGYLAVDEKMIHYWYVESQNAPATDPLIWWSNGGPGCSGLMGFLTEHGPFRPTTGGAGLVPYEYSWNTVANVLYVEAPAGVGFSYSTNPQDYNTNDTQTALDNYAAIQQFFIRFPHLTSNDFYLSAESYGGHYVPELAEVIIDSTPYLSNFKGFLLGNPLTDMVENVVYGEISTLCGHSLASKPACDNFRQLCILASPPEPSWNQTYPLNKACTDAVHAVQSEAGGLDAYGVDYPVCNQGQEMKKTLAHIYKERMYEPGFPQQMKAQLEAVLHPPKRKHAHGARDNDFDNDMYYDPCEDSEETTYLNRADVRTALHISSSPSSPTTWSACSGPVNYKLSDELILMEPIYTKLIASGKNLRLVVYSGDDDTICASLGTQEWMYNLFGNEVTQTWTQWMYNSVQYGQQIGGSIVQFTGVSLVTVHSAGHMVSQYQPERGLAVLVQFLAGDFTTTAQL